MLNFKNQDTRHLIYTTPDTKFIFKKEFTFTNNGQLKPVQRDITLKAGVEYTRFDCIPLLETTAGAITYSCICYRKGIFLDQLQISVTPTSSSVVSAYNYNRYNSEPVRKVSMSKEYFGVITSEEQVSVTQTVSLYKLKVKEDDKNLNNIYSGKHFVSNFALNMDKFFFGFSPIIFDKETESQFCVYNSTLNQIVSYKINEFSLKMLTGVYASVKATDVVTISNEQNSLVFKLNSIFKEAKKTDSGSGSGSAATTNSGWFGWIQKMPTWQLVSLIAAIFLTFTVVMVWLFYRWKRYQIVLSRKSMNHLFVHKLEDFQVKTKDFGVGEEDQF